MDDVDYGQRFELDLYGEEAVDLILMAQELMHTLHYTENPMLWACYDMYIRQDKLPEKHRSMVMIIVSTELMAQMLGTRPMPFIC